MNPATEVVSNESALVIEKRISREFGRNGVYEAFQGSPKRPCCLRGKVSVGGFLSSESQTHNSVHFCQILSVCLAVDLAK